jgi:hypothetical protein
VRFYRNIGPGTFGAQPQFSSAEGVHIVEPPCPMLVSGADAKDFNGDGDIDILTGQGHGGSGLRFYERDYINDLLNHTSPIVSMVGVLPDAVAPGAVTGLSATPGNQRCTLRWTNPSGSDFAATTIRFRTDAFPAGPADGTLLVETTALPGSAEEYLHTALTNGATYFYAAFARDCAGHYGPAMHATVVPFVSSDFDGDGDVDLSDFSLLQICFHGPNQPVSTGCRPMDFDDDADVDLSDFAVFQGCFNGPNRPQACR